MEKSMARMLVILLTLALLATLTIGCGKVPDTSDPTESSAPDEDETTTPSSDGNNTTTKTTANRTSSKAPSKDLKGYDFVIASYFMPLAGTSDYDDAVLARNAQVEKELNCTIRYELYSDVTFFDDVSPALMAGDKVADLMIPCMHSMGRLINAQYLYDINDLKEIDMSAVYYDKVGFENTTLASGTYGLLAPFIGWKDPGAIIYNKDLIKKMGLTDPMEYVRKGQWTWDTFKTLVSKSMKDLNNDGAYTGDDQWAVTALDYNNVTNFYLSSGNGMLAMKNKKIEYVMDQQKALDALTAMKNMLTVPGGIFYVDATTNGAMFDAGKVVFKLQTAQQPAEWGYGDFEHGVVPMPMGNNTKSYPSSVTHNAPIACVPITIDNPTATGIIINRLAQLSYEKNEEKLRLEKYTGAYMNDGSHEMFEKYIYPNTIFDVSMLYKSMSLNVYNATEVVACNPIILDPANYVAGELIESYKGTCTKFLKVINGK